MRLLRLVILLLPLSIPTYANDWEKIDKPIQGKMQSIGKYFNGCVIGAKALPLQGRGYQVIHSYKNRFYGHQDLISFIKKLGKEAQKSKLSTVLVADMGMPAGGRFSSGHASHQTGLDADIWLRLGSLTKEQAENPTATVYVSGEKTNKNWTVDQAKLIRLAALDKKVARIFVNPAIKVKLCVTARGNRSWLRKVRPWYGHTAHMHVRLHCPKNSPYCKKQTPTAKGEGCGKELYSWFIPKDPAKKNNNPKKKKMPKPPALCQKILLSQ